MADDKKYQRTSRILKVVALALMKLSNLGDETSAKEQLSSESTKDRS